MIYTQLGKSGVKVSKLCLGTMNFGSKCDEKESFRIMDRALELNINFFDTANRYGDPKGEGITESIIGRWLALGGRRERIFLASKFFGPMGSGANDGNLSAYHMRQACDDSLRRLQTDRIDLYQMHHIDRGIPHRLADLAFVDGNKEKILYPPHLSPGTRWPEIWQGYEQLTGAGKIIYAGSSNFAAWNIAQANEKALARNYLGLISEQSKYNLAQRTVELEMVPVCREYQVGLICWSPLAGGMLAGKLDSSDSGRRSGLQLTPRQSEQKERYEKLCAEIGEAPAVVALAWLISNPVVTAPIIGPRTVEQLESAVRAIELELDDEFMQKLDEIFPGPGNQAPEAYAW